MPLPAGWEARVIHAEESGLFLSLLCDAYELNFEAAAPLFYGDPFFDVSSKFILIAPDVGPVSCLTVIPSNLNIGGASVPVGGITGVATHPGFQNQGCASALLQSVVSLIADDLHFPLSLLAPASDEFYRRLGWERATQSLLWATPPSALPPHREGARVRRMVPKDWASVYRLQEEYARNETGAARRDLRRWQVIQATLPEDCGAVYTASDGQVRGYLLYERSPLEGSELFDLRLHEMVGETPSARRGLLGFLAQQHEVCRQIHWPTSASLLRLFSLPIPIQPWEPGLMARIASFEGLLSCLHETCFAQTLAEMGRSLKVIAVDPIRPENENALRISPSGIQKGDENDTDWIRADIRTFAQIVFGYVTPSDASVVGLLQFSSADVLLLANRLFPAREPFVPPLDRF